MLETVKGARNSRVRKEREKEKLSKYTREMRLLSIS